MEYLGSRRPSMQSTQDGHLRTPTSSRRGGLFTDPSAMAPSSQTSNDVHLHDMSRDNSRQGLALTSDPNDTIGVGDQFREDRPMEPTQLPVLSNQAQGHAPPGHIRHAKLRHSFNTLFLDVVTDAPGLSQSEVQDLRDHAQRIFAGVDNVFQSAIQPGMGFRAKPAPSTRTMPPNIATYCCKLCPKDLSSRYVLNRHFGTEHKISQYRYYCRWPGCHIFDHRKDKIREHLEKQHSLPKELSDAEAEHIQVEMPLPQQCPMCGCPVDSWSTFHNCIAVHCYVGPNHTKKENDGGNDDGGEGVDSGDDGSGPNKQYFSGTGLGGSILRSFVGDASGFPSQRHPHCHSVYRGVNRGQNGSAGIYDAGQLPSSVFYDQRLGMDGTGDARTVIQSGTIDQSSQSTMRTPTAVQDASPCRKLNASLPGTPHNTSRRAAQSRTKPSKREKKQKARSKRRCKSCLHSADDCLQCPLQQDISQCHACVDKSAHLLQTRLSDLQPHGQTQGFGEGVPNEASASRVTEIVDPNRDLSDSEAWSLFNNTSATTQPASDSNQVTQSALPNAQNVEVYGSGEPSADGPWFQCPLGTGSVFREQTPRETDQTSWNPMLFPVFVSPTTLDLPEPGPAISKLPTDDLYGSCLKGLGISGTGGISDILRKSTDSMVVSDFLEDKPLSGKIDAQPQLTSNLGIPKDMAVPPEDVKEQYTAFLRELPGMVLLAAASAAQMYKQPPQEDPSTNAKRHSLRRKAQVIAKLLKLRTAVQEPQTQTKAIDKPAFSTSELRMLQSLGVSSSKNALYLRWLLPQLLRAFFANMSLVGGLASGDWPSAVDINLENVGEVQSMMFLACIVILLLGAPAHHCDGLLLE